MPINSPCPWCGNTTLTNSLTVTHDLGVTIGDEKRDAIFRRVSFTVVLPPAKGGNEKTWIQQYVDVRHDWLATHPRKVLQNTVYRTQCFKREIARNNWDLSQVPIDANGVNVFGQ